MKKNLLMSALVLTSLSYANASPNKENTTTVTAKLFFKTPTTVTYNTSCGTTHVVTYDDRPSDAMLELTITQYNIEDCDEDPGEITIS